MPPVTKVKMRNASAIRLLSDRALTRRTARSRNAVSGREKAIARRKAPQPERNPVRSKGILFMPNQCIAYMRDSLKERTGKRFIQLLPQFMDMGTQSIAVRRRIPPDGLFKFRSGDDGWSGPQQCLQNDEPRGAQAQGNPAPGCAVGRGIELNIFPA